jgi:hypothetical protein
LYQRHSVATRSPNHASDPVQINIKTGDRVLFAKGGACIPAYTRRDKRMRIAQIAPLFERVPPRLYGGSERIVSYLTEELVRQGHDVTLFAS